MISRKNQTELDRTLERQLARCLDEQLQFSNAPSGSDLAVELPSGGSGLDDLMSLVDQMGKHLSLAKSKIDQEKKIARKYVEMCSLVKGLLANFRKLSTENDAKAETIVKLKQAVAEHKKQLLDSRQLIASLQDELLRTVNQADEDRKQMNSAKAQAAQLKQLLRISNANESADVAARITIEETPTPQTAQVVGNLAAPSKREIVERDEAGQQLLKQIDDMLAQIPVSEVSAGKIAA